MRALLCCALLGMWAVHPASAAFPLIATSVDHSPDAMTYTYTLSHWYKEVWSFSVWLPASVLPTVTSISGPNGEWQTSMDRRGDVGNLGWWTTGEGIHPWASGTFTVVTQPDVPTGYDYVYYSGTNWNWGDWDGAIADGGYGNTLLPVPVPEPSPLSFLSLALASVGIGVLRRRR